MGAAILSVPEVELDRDESKKLGDAIKDVGRHYAMVFDARYVAIANLGAVAGFIYGPRIIAYRARRKAEKEAEKPTVQKSAGSSDSGVRNAPQPIRQEKADPMIVPVAKMPNGKTSPQMAPSQLWPEPAAEFPGLG
jgi:hypothetical protein